MYLLLLICFISQHNFKLLSLSFHLSLKNSLQHCLQSSSTRNELSQIECIRECLNLLFYFGGKFCQVWSFQVTGFFFFFHSELSICNPIAFQTSWILIRNCQSYEDQFVQKNCSCFAVFKILSLAFDSVITICLGVYLLFLSFLRFIEFFQWTAS